MPSKNEIDYTTRQEHIFELINESMRLNRGNYGYTLASARIEAAAKVGLSYRHLLRALEPYKCTKAEKLQKSINPEQTKLLF